MSDSGKNSQGQPDQPSAPGCADLTAVARRVGELWQELDQLRSQLAAHRPQAAQLEASFHVLCCQVGGEHMAFLHDSVEEVVMMAKLVPLPEAPHWVPGLLNLRGRMVVVIDVLARLSKVARRQELGDLIVICQTPDRPVGLVVQEVLHSASCRADQLEQPPQGVIHAPYLLGVLQVDSQPTLLLSTESLVATSSLPTENG